MDRYEATVRIFVAFLAQGWLPELAMKKAIEYANAIKAEVG